MLLEKNSYQVNLGLLLLNWNHSRFHIFCRVWAGAGGIRVRSGNKDQDSQRDHAGGAFPDEEPRLQDVQDAAAESWEVHLREQPGCFHHQLDGEAKPETKDLSVHFN